MKQKILSLSVLLIMILTLFPVAVSAEEAYSGTCGENATWSYGGMDCLTINGSGDMYDYDYGNLSHRYAPWGDNMYIIRCLREIAIEPGITHIGARSFSQLVLLDTVTIPASVTSIGENAFYDCSNIDVVYYGGSEAQWNNIYIDSGNDYLTSAAIQYDTKAEESNLCGDNVTWTLDNSGTLTISGTGEMWSFMLRNKPWDVNSVKRIVINDGVTLVSSNAFAYYPNLTSVTILSRAIKIDTFAFQKSESLTNVTLSEGVTEIGNNAFYECSNLRTINLPSSLKKIGSSAFYGSGLTTINIPNTIKTIEDNAFANCSRLITATTTTLIHENTYNMLDWGTNVFSNCASLTSVVIPEGAYLVIDFDNCTSLKSVYIPETVNTLDIDVAGCPNLTDIYFERSEASPFLAYDMNNDSTRNKFHYSVPLPNTLMTGTAAAVPTNDKLEVNGSAADPTVYKINGSNYFKIRDVAALLNGTEKQFAVGYDGEKNAVTATTGQGYAKQSGDLAGAAKGGNQNAAASNDAIYVNGEKITAEVYKIGGSNYFKLRDLGKALNFYVGWTAERGMYIETNKPYSE